jgi:hypothetical protein
MGCDPQSIEASVAPKVLYKKTASPAALNVEVKTGKSDGVVPSPPVHDGTTIDAATTESCTPKPEPKKK